MLGHGSGFYSGIKFRKRKRQVNLIVSKNLDVMKSKAQFASKRGSVVCYVTKRVAGCSEAEGRQDRMRSRPEQPELFRFSFRARSVILASLR